MAVIPLEYRSYSKVNVHICVEDSNELNPSSRRSEHFEGPRESVVGSSPPDVPGYLYFPKMATQICDSSIQRVVTCAKMINMSNETLTDRRLG